MTRAMVALGVATAGLLTAAWQRPLDAPLGFTRARASVQAKVERRLLSQGRNWYRHLIYAPRFTYAPEVLPGVSEAIEAGDGGRANAQARRLADALRRAAAALDRRN